MLGITAEYIGRIFEEVKRRPLYIVSHVENVDAKRASGVGLTSDN